ncbi:MAG: cytochrome c3 family protein [Lewinellaceae bacterium]|nr:cytochrome c3 family protein [Saprospiraceae bacterium]MCB9341246.1 cytochrome c3 family protein [Lewinellaceae bacterium]
MKNPALFKISILDDNLHFARVMIPLLFLLAGTAPINAQEGEPTGQRTTEGETVEKKFTNKEENALCLKCHANKYVRFTPEGSDQPYIFKMYSDCIIDTTKYYASNHWNFKCVDCHSSDYETYPHLAGLRFEYMATCLDCHGDDPEYAKFHFEKIQEQYEASVHFSKYSNEISCWSCHNSHYYKINARNRDQDIKMTIAYDNAICLGCHANTDNFEMIAERLNPDVTTTHEWLPNQANHFKSVRCIECHAEINDTLLVAHKILPKEQAVKKCVECHSSDSRLKASLYKYQLEEGASLVKDDMIGDAVLIGSRRSTTVNLLSNILILATVLGILGHWSLRIITRKKTKP